MGTPPRTVCPTARSTGQRPRPTRGHTHTHVQAQQGFCTQVWVPAVSLQATQRRARQCSSSQPGNKHHVLTRGFLGPGVWFSASCFGPLFAQGSQGRQGTHPPLTHSLTFQNIKLMGSTTVGWMISRPGKMPHVTALGCSSGALVMFFP